MGYFEGPGDYNNATGVQPSASNVFDGNSARVQNGDLYDEQNGNVTLVWNGDLNSLRKGYDNSLVEGKDFSTTLGASFVTVAGANTSTMAGGVVETVALFSIRTVAGWDVDIKLGWQSRRNIGPVYDYDTSDTYRASTWKDYELFSGKVGFGNKFTRYCEARSEEINSLAESAATMLSSCETKVEEVFSETEYPVVLGGDYKVRAAGGFNLVTLTGASLLGGQGSLYVRGSRLVVNAQLIELGG